MSEILITAYAPQHQEEIDRMMQGIEKEFAEPVSSPQSTRLNEVYQCSDNHFWVALHGEKVVGTAGLQTFAGGQAVLKRMMVDSNYRGKDYGTASLLLEECFSWARQHHFKEIFLGTMMQFKAAQRFYHKKGFSEIVQAELPADYVSNPIDTLFYKITL